MARPPSFSSQANISKKHGIDKSKVPQLLGFGHTTDYLALEKKDAPTFSTARKAAEKAFGMANLKPRDMNGAEVHDCFSITEIVATKFSAWPSRAKVPSWPRAARPRSRKCAANTSAARLTLRFGQRWRRLIGDGHPVGATGVRQVVDAYQQLTNQAGAHQIPGAKKFLTFNMGAA